MNRRLLLIVLLIGALVAVAAGSAFFLASKNHETQLNQKQTQSESESNLLPDQPKITTSLIQSADQLAETLKTYNIQTDVTVPQVDYASQTLLAFIYQSPTPGFLIEASVSDGSAEVVVTAPGKGCAKSQVVTSIVAYSVVSLTQQAPVVNSQTKTGLADCNF